MKTLTITATQNGRNEIVVTCEIHGHHAATIVYNSKLEIVRSLCDDRYHLVQFEYGALKAAKKLIRGARAA